MKLQLVLMVAEPPPVVETVSPTQVTVSPASGSESLALGLLPEPTTLAPVLVVPST